MLVVLAQANNEAERSLIVQLRVQLGPPKLLHRVSRETVKARAMMSPHFIAFSKTAVIVGPPRAPKKPMLGSVGEYCSDNASMFFGALGFVAIISRDAATWWLEMTRSTSGSRRSSRTLKGRLNTKTSISQNKNTAPS